jgi:hypothetical protein
MSSNTVPNWTALPVDTTAGIKEENSRMRAEIMCGYQTIQTMRRQLAEYE